MGRQLSSFLMPKSHELISSLQHVKCFMMMMYGMMVEFVGLSTVKQKVCGNTRFLFLMGAVSNRWTGL